MMHRNKIWLLLLLAIGSCTTQEPQTNIPDVPVDIEVDLTSIDNQALQQLGGFIYLDGGVRGIVLIHTTTTDYVALDRNCTYQPTDAKAIVSMHSSGFFLEDPSCGSTFDLNGFPTGGPAEFPLKEYSISRAGDILFIIN